jgi:hypothetical protein
MTKFDFGPLVIPSSRDGQILHSGSLLIDYMLTELYLTVIIYPPPPSLTGAPGQIAPSTPLGGLLTALHIVETIYDSIVS